MSLASLSAQVEEPEQQENNIAPPGVEGFDFPCAALSIKRFQNDGTFKPLKVVVGLPIDYKASPKNLDPYSWTLGNSSGTDFWTLDNNGVAPYVSPNTNTGIMYIPESAMPLDNSDFGLSKGELTVKTSNETATESVEVFFEKDKKNNPGGVDPNWFYYLI